MNPKDLLTSKETAELLGVTPRTLRNWVNSGDFPRPFKLGRTPYYHPNDIAQFLEERAANR